MRRVIDAVCQWYCDFFGTETAFAIAVVAALAWALLIAVQGYARWNTGPGLLGNTVESTLELFFEIAILVVARRVDKTSQRQQAHMARQVKHNMKVLDHLARMSAFLDREADELVCDLDRLADMQPGIEARKLARRIARDLTR